MSSSFLQKNDKQTNMLKWNTMKIGKVLTNHHKNRQLLIKSLFKEMSFKFLFKDIHRFRQSDVTG